MNVALYHTVSAESIQELDRIVNDKIDQGWEIYGNPYACNAPADGSASVKHLVCQALTFDVDTYSGMSALERRKLRAIATGQKE